MKQTSVEHIGRSQLIPGVRQTAGRVMKATRSSTRRGTTAALVILLTAGGLHSAYAADRRVTASSVMTLVQQKGASGALDMLFGSAQWDSVLDGIAGGGAGWLRVAAALRPVSDAGASEDLHQAISEALGTNAPGVLRLVKDGAVAAEDACLLYGFMTQTPAANKAKLQHFVARRRKAVSAVTDPVLAKPKSECLAQLDRAERDIDAELKKP
jgi:hypothetical protein